LQETVSNFKGGESPLRGHHEERTSLTDSELTGLFHQGESKDLAFAKEKGIIKDIRAVRITPGSPFLALNFP